MYDLDVKELSDGKIKGVSYGYPMTGSECFLLGSFLIDNEFHQDGIQWMEEGLNKLTDDEVSVYKDSILDQIQKSNEKIGKSLKKNNQLIPRKLPSKLDISLQTFKLKVLYKDKLKSEEENNAPKIEDSNATIDHDTNEEYEEEEYEYYAQLSYKRLCNGEDLRPKYLLPRLRCRYLSENHAFTKIGPLKVEEIFLGPRILLIHDILNNFEMSYLKETIAEHLISAQIGNKDEKKFVENTSMRATKIGWLGCSDPVAKKVMRRGAYITGLNVVGDEEDALQVGNYGLGGHYLMHHDYFGEADVDNVYGVEEEHERVATILYYLSDVEMGGSTVFPTLGVSVKARKHTAVYWENLYPSGRGRFNTLHAACPVLIGSKWIATHWITRKHQELIRPCNLEPEQEDYTIYTELD